MKTNWPALRSGFLILASLTAGARYCPRRRRRSTAATTKTAVISSVAILQTAAQERSVRVEGEGKLEVGAARMQNPDRLVLDFIWRKTGDAEDGGAGCRPRYAEFGSDNSVVTWCGW